MIPVYATIPGHAGRVLVGEAERDGDTVRVRLDALLSGDARIEMDLPDADAGNAALGAAMLDAVEAAQPYYGRGPHGAVRLYREEDGTWSAGRNDDTEIRCEGASSPTDALTGLAAELRAEHARRCPHCGVADDHDDLPGAECPGRRAGYRRIE